MLARALPLLLVLLVSFAQATESEASAGQSLRRMQDKVNSRRLTTNPGAGFLDIGTSGVLVPSPLVVPSVCLTTKGMNEMKCDELNHLWSTKFNFCCTSFFRSSLRAKTHSQIKIIHSGPLWPDYAALSPYPQPSINDPKGNAPFPTALSQAVGVFRAAKCWSQHFLIFLFETLGKKELTVL